MGLRVLCWKTISAYVPAFTIGPEVFSAIDSSVDKRVCLSKSNGSARLVFPLLFAPTRTVIGRTSIQPVSVKLRNCSHLNEKRGKEGFFFPPGFRRFGIFSLLQPSLSAEHNMRVNILQILFGRAGAAPVSWGLGHIRRSGRLLRVRVTRFPRSRIEALCEQMRRKIATRRNKAEVIRGSRNDFAPNLREHGKQRGGGGKTEADPSPNQNRFGVRDDRREGEVEPRVARGAPAASLGGCSG